MFSLKCSFFVFIVLLFGSVYGKPADAPVENNKNDQVQNEVLVKILEGEPEQKEDFGRFVVTQVGTMMCYRAWEVKPESVDFHLCNICYNDTQKSQAEVPQNQYITQVETCFNKFLSDTDYKECYPMLRNPAAPNKPYDILVSEPPVEFSYRNFARCAHGVVFKQETAKCVKPTDSVQGVEPFLDKFSCLMSNLVTESKRFSEANYQELLRSVPKNASNATATKA